MGQHNLNTTRAGTRSMVYSQLTVKQTAAAELEAVLETALGDTADKVTTDADVVDAHTKIVSFMRSTFLIQITASLCKNGKL
jgi:Mg2+ and Co2+ transporter CorA